MKIEVMVDKDNTHFSYKFDCDKVIDGSREGRMRPQDDNGKLVVMKKTGKKEKREQGGSSIEVDVMETVAVFNHWTFWRVIENDAEKCKTCGRFEKLNKDGHCQKCQE